MRIDIRDVFLCTREQYWTSMDDPALDAALTASSNTTYTVLEEREEDGVVFRRQRVASGTTLPRAVAKALGARTLTYEQETWTDRSKDQIRWKVIPPVFPDKVTAEGTYELKEHRDGVIRVVSGEISVRVPFLGGTIEKAIAEQLKSSYATGVELRNDWIRDNC